MKTGKFSFLRDVNKIFYHRERVCKVTIQKIETFSVCECLLPLPDGTVLPSSEMVTGRFDTKLF